MTLVVQWLRIQLLMQGTQVPSLDQEDPTCCRAANPVHRNYWAWVLRACALQQEKPLQWDARTRQGRVAPACQHQRKPVCGNEDPEQPKIKFKNQPALNGSIWSVPLSSDGTWHPVSWCSVVWISIAWLPFFFVMSWDQNKYLIGLLITWKLVVGISL